MRIASSQIYQQGINNMIDVSRQLAKTQQQVSSGKRFATPADDPVAASQVVQINQELALRDQYQKNIQQVSSQLGARRFGARAGDGRAAADSRADGAGRRRRVDGAGPRVDCDGNQHAHATN